MNAPVHKSVSVHHFIFSNKQTNKKHATRASAGTKKAVTTK